ncbi:MAG TPA: hypothetical protein PL045_00650 [Chitinophagaceae bacterium]|nr:hypothetical protein [Chitinophagaceae bacterium]
MKAQSATKTNNITDELKKLSELKIAGYLSEEEFKLRKINS